MFKIFARRREPSPVMNRGLQQLGKVVERGQRQAAGYLNGKAAGFSRRQLVWGLVVFCIVFGGSSAYTIWHSVQPSSQAIYIQPMTLPGYAILPGSERPGKSEMTGPELDHIRQFRYFLDSLRGSESGKGIYDSLVRHRPGLLDSLAFIEQFYQLQLKISEDGNK